MLLDRDRQQPLAAVVEVAAEQQQRAAGEIVAQIGADLSAAIGVEAGRTDPVAGRIMAADHEMRIRRKRAGQPRIGAALAIAEQPDLGLSFQLRSAFALDDVDRDAGLAGGEQGAGTAAHRLNPADGAVEPDQLRIFEEGQRRGREEGHAFGLEGHIFGIAARRVAAHEDVRAILSTRAFDREAGDQPQYVRRAGRRQPLDRGLVDRGDGISRVVPADAATGRADDHHVGQHGCFGGGGGRDRRQDRRRRGAGYRLSHGRRVRDDQDGAARRMLGMQSGPSQ